MPILPSIGRHALPMLKLPKLGGSAGLTMVGNYVTGSYTFSAPVTGAYQFYMSAGGGGGYLNTGSPWNGGASGAKARRRVMLAKGQSVSFTIGRGGRGNASPEPGFSTVITWPDGVTTLNGGDPGGNGTANGGTFSGLYDEAVNGVSTPITNGIGANAPVLSVDYLTPGVGGAVTSQIGAPGSGTGAGAGSSNSASTTNGGASGASGQVVIMKEA